jgi:hypothetical protein
VKRRHHAGPLAGLCLVLGACAGPAEAPAPGLPAAEPPAETVIEQLPPRNLLDPVLRDAGERSGLPRDALQVTASRRVTWSDGSLGCPEPGRMYTQALVPGWHVMLVAGDLALDYRLADSGAFVLCGAEPDRLRGEP